MFSLHSQPRNRTMTDVVAAGDLAHRLAVAVASLDRLALLVVGQFRLAAHLDAAALARSPSPVRVRINSFSNSAQAAWLGQHQATVRGRGVGPCIAE